MNNNGSNEAQQASTALDLELADLMYRSLGAVEAVGRFGPRKVFVSALWGAMLRVDAFAVGRLAGGKLARFKRWLVGAQRLIRSEGEGERTPLVVLARADLVAAMPGALVADSETLTDGASYHFVLDPASAPDAYTPAPRLAMEQIQPIAADNHRQWLAPT